MRFIVYVIISTFCFSSYALQSVEELNKRAQSSQQGLIEVIAEIKGDMSQITGRRQFDEYFELLPILEIYAKAQGLDDIYPGAIKDLGKHLVAHGNRWLRIESDIAETITSYQKWADLDTSQRFLYQVQDQLLNIDLNLPFDEAFKNLIALSELTEIMFPNDLYISQGYSNSVSDFSFKIIKNTSLDSVDEVNFWISGLRNQASIVDFLTYVNNIVLDESISDDDALKWFKSLTNLGVHIKKSPFANSSSIRPLYGDVFTEALVNLIIREVSFEQVLLINEIRQHLTLSKVRHLTSRVIGQHEIISDDYFLYFYNLNIQIYVSLIGLGLNEDAAQLLDAISANLDAKIASILDLEGTYALVDQKGVEWIFTFVRSNYNELIGALSSKDGSITYNYFSIKYSFFSSGYSAAEFDLNYSTDFAEIITFDFNSGDGKITINFPYLNSPEDTTLSGVKIDGYENVSNPNLEKIRFFPGVYTSEMKLLGENDSPVTLKLSEFNDTIIGNLKSNDGVLDVNLVSNMDGLEGYIYLTGECAFCNDSWIHLRLVFAKTGELHGYQVLGGKGRDPKEIHFVKQD